MTPEQDSQLLKLDDPPAVEGWCSHEKACVLFKLVEDYKPELCLEIGTFGGRACIAIAMGLKSMNRGIIFGIDPWVTSAAIEGTNSPEDDAWWSQVPWERIVREYYDRMQQFDLLPLTAHFRKHDLDCLIYFNDESINLIHFDSNHSEEVAVRTVHSWWPKLAEGCVIVMDDIKWEGQSKAVAILSEYGCETIKEYDTYAVYRKPVSVPVENVLETA